MDSVESADEAAKLHKRRLMSKYDSVKVYVWFPGDPPHSYILSRYLTARMLTVAKIPFSKSVKIALGVKKYLVDRDLLSISQGEMEECLFSHMKARSYGEHYFQRLMLVNRFFSEKRPLIMTLCGVPCIGKSTFAQKLAERFNISNVLQTDLIYELQRSGDMALSHRKPLLETPNLKGRELIQDYERECLFVRSALETELHKVRTLHADFWQFVFQAVSEGKALMMEGFHLDPALYLPEFAQLNALTFPCTDSVLPLAEHHTGDASERPLYIPIVVTASREDHQLLSHEAIYRTGSRFFEPQSTEQSRLRGPIKAEFSVLGGSEVFCRLRELNQYLVEHRHPTVAHVHVGLSSSTEALDQLHDHFLKCIYLSMQF